MAEQHIKLLQGLGVDQATIDQVEGLTPETLKDWVPDDTLKAIKEVQKTSFLNDAEFLGSIPEDKIPQATLKKVEAGQYGRFMNELLSLSKSKLGLEDTDLADLSEDDKKSLGKAFVKIATKHLDKKGGVEGAKKLQEQVSALTDQLEAEKTGGQEKLDTELQKVNTATGAKLIKALTKVELASLDGVELSAPAGYLTDALLAKLQNNYTVKLNDRDELELKQKENPALDAMEGGKKVTFTEALKKLVLTEKVGKAKEVKDEKDSKRKTITISGEGGDDEIALPEYITNRAKQNMDE